MKICVVQAMPVKGDIQSNIANHKRLIDLAVSAKANVIIFPELSITSYEPELAEELATDENDPRFDDFQKISDHQNVTIGIGMPTRHDTGILISMIIFAPHKPRMTYSKQYIHEDEMPYFTTGQQQVYLTMDEQKIAPAICYELSVPDHAENAYKNRSTIYIASVAKPASGVKKASKSLSGIAAKYSMTVMMSNALGYCDNFESGGQSSIWNNKGELVEQLNDTDEGILIYDTDTGKVIKQNAETDKTRS